MSFGPMITEVRCKCGERYETDMQTMGVHRKACAYCTLVNALDFRYEMLGVVKEMGRMYVTNVTKEEETRVVDRIVSELDTKEIGLAVGCQEEISEVMCNIAMSYGDLSEALEEFQKKAEKEGFEIVMTKFIEKVNKRFKENGGKKI